MPLHTKLCMLLLLFSLPGFGQYDVEGVVRNELTETISGATVSIQEVGNAQPKQTKTDGNGKFKFNLSNGTYTLTVSFQGYSTYHKTDIQVAGNPVDLGIIQLIPAHQSIEAIQVMGQKKLIEHKSDRMVINIENSILADGMTALEILQRAPAVKVDDDGNINMRGKSDVAVMINGKLSYLAPKDLATLLKGTPSSSLKSIELITNPSAKYDAQGMGGIINIQMKAARKSGFNVSVNSFGGAGRKERYGAGVNMNAQSGKWILCWAMITDSVAKKSTGISTAIFLRTHRRNSRASPSNTPQQVNPCAQITPNWGWISKPMKSYTLASVGQAASEPIKTLTTASTIFFLAMRNAFRIL